MRTGDSVSFPVGDIIGGDDAIAVDVEILREITSDMQANIDMEALGARITDEETAYREWKWSNWDGNHERKHFVEDVMPILNRLREL